MRVITVNAGSASVKLAMFETDDSRLNLIRRQSLPPDASPAETLQAFIAEYIGRIDGVCHRVVHGGDDLVDSCLLNARVEKEIRRLGDIAPLHNPAAAAWFKAARSVLGPRIRQVVVFDTAYFSELPQQARYYALPRQLTKRLSIRRYGFHGIAHRTMATRWQALRPELPQGGRLITIQLGGGCSMAAILEGRPQDTSMGFSPVEGLVMASRTGDLDPSVIPYVMRRENYSTAEVDRLLNERSGMLGLAGNADMKSLLASKSADAEEAIELYCYRLQKYIGAYLVVLGSADGIVFGGGVGEHASEIRRRVMERFQWLGVALDAAANAEAVGVEKRIAAPESSIDVWVIPVDESVTLAREAVQVLSASQ